MEIHLLFSWKYGAEVWSYTSLNHSGYLPLDITCELKNFFKNHFSFLLSQSYVQTCCTVFTSNCTGWFQHAVPMGDLEVLLDSSILSTAANCCHYYVLNIFTLTSHIYQEYSHSPGNRVVALLTVTKRPHSMGPVERLRERVRTGLP